MAEGDHEEAGVITLRWGLAGELGVQPIVFITLPRGSEASWGGGLRALLEAVADLAGWGKHKAEVLGGKCVPCVMVTVAAAHFSETTQPRYCKELARRLESATFDLPTREVVVESFKMAKER